MSNPTNNSNLPNSVTSDNVKEPQEPTADLQLSAGHHRCASKNAKCQLVGEYCGTYVWIPPSGRNEFTNLTLTILDIAFSKPATAAKLTKDVTIYLDEDDNPVSWRTATQQVRATIPIDRHNDVILRASYIAELEALLRKYGLTTADLGNFSIQGWSSADLGRLDRITNYLQLGINIDKNSLRASAPAEAFDAARNRIPTLMEVLPMPAPSPPAAAGDLLQLQRELNRVTIPQQ